MQYGNLDSFSAYKNENYMQELKKNIRKPNKILQQLHNRIAEQTILSDARLNLGLVSPFSGGNSSYRGYKFDSYILKNNVANGCCHITPDIIFNVEEFQDINGEECILGRRYQNKDAFFELPINSTDLGIFKISNLLDTRETFPINLICFKYVRIYLDDICVVVPMLHHSTN